MLINSIELSSLGVRLYDRVITSNQITTTQDWLDGDIQPTYIRQQDKFKNMTLKFLVMSADEDEAYKRISRLTSMLKKASIRFDDLDLVFDVRMSGQNATDRLKNGNFIVSYNLTCDYAKGEREIYTTNANMTNSFKLTVLYYQNSTTLIASDTITVRASSFNGVDDSLEKIGIDVNKYHPEHYNYGVATNLTNMELNYVNLQNLKALIINYSPIVYNIKVDYYLNDGTGYYNEILSATATFTYPQLQKTTSIGQIVDMKTYKPDGYKATISYDKGLTVDELLSVGTIAVFYDKIANEASKNVVINYMRETDDGSFETIYSAISNFKESQFVEGMTLGEVISVGAHRPTGVYYNEGYIEEHNATDLISYETLETSYTVKYTRLTTTLFVEYYAGTYPDWYRLTTTTITTKYKDAYEENFDVLTDINIDLDKYHTTPYEKGLLYNTDVYTSYENVINAGVLQVFYKPIDYPIVVRYYPKGLDSIPVEETLTINDLMFLSNPVLGDIVPITAHRPEGYQFSPDLSYAGEVSLSALTQASPIDIVYEEIVELKTKNIIVRYKKELSSAYSTINSNLITINEADCIGGVRLKDIINLDIYQPEYYESGIIDGASSTALLTYEQIGSSYDVLYVAKSYTTPVRYYTDDIDDLNWIGSATISYRVIDFTTTTTLFDLGLNINAFKPGYCGDGILQYNGPVNFTALLELSSIDVLYETEIEPDDPDGIDYPHRFLFLQHNDLGDYEHLHPEWTMNHAFINTGVSADDMSKLTVIMECDRVDTNVPLHEVNAGYAYLFGSSSGLGSFYMRFNNQTQFGTNLTGVNTYEARAGYYSNGLTQTEESAIGFGPNSGIYSSAQEGYSRVIFTYSNNLPTDKAQMPYPIYLFANNKNGNYEDGLAGIGIYSCRIYYNDELIRDFIPVQFYDKIGDQIAPSNCLYDKVSRTFFEDGTGLNSFNIRDDDRYEDTNPEHKIGKCYVHYYKGEELFQSSMIWFRASEFIEGYWDMYDRFLVDEYQPAYYRPGQVVVDKDFRATFETLNNQVFNVVYAEEENQIVAKYWREEADGTRVLLAEDTLPISEKDFYQVPTFGDIVRLNKYKPEGYETDFVYQGKKVSLSRVLDLSPYDIVYKPMAEEPVEYSTVIRYIKKVYGLRTYEVVATETRTFNQSDFRDGEYIDFYIDFNGYKPQYYIDGEPYEWYRMDERLDAPEMLKDVYTVYYMPEVQYVDVNYYTDDIDEANMIASTTWGFKIDDYEGEIQLTDTLPNEYINKYKPVGCAGGQLLNPERWYSFEDLVNLDEISIWYETIVEPDDPENVSYEQKVLYWGIGNSWIEGLCLQSHAEQALAHLSEVAGRIPYIDLGYRPKEIGRLRVEFVGTCMGVGYKSGRLENELTSKSFSAGGLNHASGSLGYTSFFGYQTPVPSSIDGEEEPHNTLLNGDRIVALDDFSRNSKGGFALFTRIPLVGGWAYTAEGPQSYDGGIYYAGGSAAGVIAGGGYIGYNGYTAVFRRGMSGYLDDNYESQRGFHTYMTRYRSKVEDYWVGCFGRTGEMGAPVDIARVGHWFANPFHITMDAYNGYFEHTTHEWSNHPTTQILENIDNDFFEGREQPRGTLSLFQSTDPNTGKVNIMAFNPTAYPQISSVGTPIALQNSALGSPYQSGWTTGITYNQVVITGQDSQGNPIYENKTTSKNINYARFPMPLFPQMKGCAVWSLKIYDRDRLVRDLIPVAKGDKVYDYVMPENGLFDLITEIFFGNANKGGTYEIDSSFIDDKGGEIGKSKAKRTIPPEEVWSLQTMYDPLIFGKITNNYYDYDNSFIANQFVNVPVWYNSGNETLENILQFNDYKPDDFHLDGMIDLDADLSFERMTLLELYNMGLANIYYKLRTFTKTVVYYQDNYRIASKDLFYSLEDIQKAKTLADLGIDVDLYYTDKFKHGKVVFDETIIAEDNIKAFIDAPSPIVVYEKLSAEEAPNLLYVEYYRGGAVDDTLITVNEESPNYLDCDLDGVVLNPNGAIKYYNHYHDALYEDEKFEYFIPYQVRVVNKYAGIHRGPARRYQTLAMIIVEDTYTIIEERNGWGRLKEYPVGWIMLSQTEPMTGPGQNPDYDIADSEIATIPFGEHVHITQLTIDRLWCYVPEVQSWVKAEDISYDQAGKLYNGLGIDVVDLDTIDFSTVDNLADLGIGVDSRRLRFHDYSNYTYDGELTYEALSALHDIEIVYPETIYNYTCVYYKDNKADENELGRAGFSCSISDWNPDWDTFIATSYQFDENGEPINPTLYRDTDLTLTWDYFGFDKNLYRPAGYADGIYLWNPRSWDMVNVKFSFEEMIRTGSQYVLYPAITPYVYKGRSDSANQTALALAPESFTFLLNRYVNSYTDESVLNSNLVSDIHYEGERDGHFGHRDHWSRDFYDGMALGSASTATSPRQGTMTAYIWLGSDRFTTKTTSASISLPYNEDANTTYLYNVSNHRPGLTWVGGIGNRAKDIPYAFYVEDYPNSPNKLIPLEDSTNLKIRYDFGDADKKYGEMIENGTTGLLMTSNPAITFSQLTKPYVYGTTHNLVYYDQFNLTSYWMPVPKGLWYKFNGEDKRIEENGFYNLIDGSVVYNDKLEIFLMKDTVMEKPFNYFDDWFYNTTEIDYVVQANSAINTYVQPDIYATANRTLTKNLVFPVSLLTADADNKVVGEWYYSGDQWLQSANTSIYAGNFDKLRLHKLQQTICLLPGGDYTKFYVYLNPEDVASVGENSNNSYGTKALATVSHYYYINANGEKFYFDGAFWIPEKYTANYITEWNRNYAITVDTPYYSVPIRNDMYRVGIYLYGERITVPYVATNNQNWAYTGRGWIELDGNTSEVV